VQVQACRLDKSPTAGGRRMWKSLKVERDQRQRPLSKQKSEKWAVGADLATYGHFLAISIACLVGILVYVSVSVSRRARVHIRSILGCNVRQCVLSNQAPKDNKNQQRCHDKQRPQNVLMSENNSRTRPSSFVETNRIPRNIWSCPWNMNPYLNLVWFELFLWISFRV